MERTAIRWVVVAPVAVASALWTAHLAVHDGPDPRLALAGPAGASLGASALEREEPAPPDPLLPPALPDLALGLPAGTSGTSTARSASATRFLRVAAGPSVADIPAVALAAYQRAERVIGTADPQCHLSWQLLAALARVESDHGRSGGAVPGADGVSRPAITGPALDGRKGTALVLDTDAGDLDGDADLDRAVGPLQIIPSIWAVVGVDGDGDGSRDPQDVDDAALAAAVYLCAGDGDLARRAGLRAAVLGYNHSDAYVDQVVTIMRGYLAGAEVLPVTTSLRAGALVPLAPVETTRGGGDEQARGARDAREPAGEAGVRESGASRFPGTASITVDAPAPEPDVEPVPPPVAEPPGPPVPPEPGAPVPEPPGSPESPEPPGPDPDPEPDPDLLAEAVTACTEAGYVDDPEVADDDHDLCVAAYLEELEPADDQVEPADDPVEPADHPVEAVEPGVAP